MVEGLRGILGQMPAAEALVAQRGKEGLRKIVWPCVQRTWSKTQICINPALVTVTTLSVPQGGS